MPLLILLIVNYEAVFLVECYRQDLLLRFVGFILLTGLADKQLELGVKYDVHFFERHLVNLIRLELLAVNDIVGLYDFLHFFEA